MMNLFVLDDLKDDFNAFLRNNGIWLAVVLAVIVVAIPVTIILINKFKKKKAPKVKIAEKSLWVEALGGSDNIVSSEAYGSRLAVVLADKEKMNKEALKELGVTNFVEMSNKVTLLLEDKAGAYGVQDNEKYHIIKSVKGSIDNVVGFPVKEIKEDFNKLI